MGLLNPNECQGLTFSNPLASRPKPGLYVKTILEPQDPAYGRLRLRAQRMVGLWLSLNVLSFQTSLETWTTAAIINWKRSPKGDSCGWSRARAQRSVLNSQ